MTTSSCEDAGICEGFGCESGGGGGGGDDGGEGGDGGFPNAGGDGGVCWELWSEELSSSDGVVGIW